MESETLTRGQFLARYGALRVRYAWKADRVGRGSIFVSAAIMRMDLWRRMGRSAIGVGFWIDVGYCLDAPDVMPAGGCRGEDFSEEDLDPDSPEDAHWIGRACPVQLEVQRG